MAKQDMADHFLMMMQGNEKKTNKDNDSLEENLPVNPRIDNGLELDFIENTWDKRPLEGQEDKEEVSSTSVVVNVNGQSHPLLAMKREEKARQRNFCLTDTQFEKFQNAALAFGYVRNGKNGKREANGSAFLQAIIDLEIWNAYGSEEVSRG